MKDKELVMQCLKVAIFTGLGFWAFGIIGGLVGYIVAISKTKSE